MQDDAQLKQSLAPFREAYVQYSLILYRVESMDFDRLLKTIEHYLGLLLSSSAQVLIGKYRDELNTSSSWLQQAQLTNYLREARVDMSVYQSQFSKNDFQNQLLEDLLSQIDYHQGRLSDTLSQKLNHCMSLLFDIMDNGFSDERKDALAAALPKADAARYTSLSADQAQAAFERLQQTGIINIIKFFLGQIKRFTLQGDVFLNKLKTYSRNFVNSASLNEEALKKLELALEAANDEAAIDSIKQQLQDQGANDFLQARKYLTQFDVYGALTKLVAEEMGVLFGSGAALLPQKVVERYQSFYKRSTFENLCGRYEETNSNDPVAHSVSQINQWCERYSALEVSAGDASQLLLGRIAEQQTQQALNQLQQMQAKLSSVPALLSTIDAEIQRNKRLLSLVALTKQTYGKYSIAPTMRAVTQALQQAREEVAGACSPFQEVVDWEHLKLDPMEKYQIEQSFSEAQEQLTARLNKIDDYVYTVKYQEEDEQAKTTSAWQHRLNQLFSQATEESIVKYLVVMKRIKHLENVYLKALLVIRFDIVCSRISIKMLESMALWHTPSANKQLVSDTLKYLGLTVSDDLLRKVCPRAKGKNIQQATNSIISLKNRVLDWLEVEVLINIFQRKRAN